MQISEQGDISPAALIEGVAVPLGDAVQLCADLLAASAQPVFAHIGADVSGAREAILLAERVGGVVDHVASQALLRDLDPLRETGGFVISPMEADVRADVVLLIGTLEQHPALAWLAKPARPYGEAIERRVIAMDRPAGEHETLSTLATLRWLVKQPRLAADFPALAETAQALRGAKFGVAIWSAAHLPVLAIEMIHGLVRDLNETTRFSTLAAPVSDNGAGVQTVCGWMTGFPLRTGFARQGPEHDPWRFDAQRLIGADEADCVVWISSLPGGARPPAGVDIWLDAGVGADALRARIRIPVSGPGTGDVLFDPRVGTLTALRSGTSSAAPTVAATLGLIRERLSC